MTRQHVKSHVRRTRRGKKVLIKAHTRHRRAATTKQRVVGSHPVKLYPVRDEFGQIRGFSSKPRRRG